MSHSSNNKDSVEHVPPDLQSNYEKTEMDLLKDALNRTYTERFLFATRLYKIQQTLNKAKITHKPYISDK